MAEGGGVAHKVVGAETQCCRRTPGPTANGEVRGEGAPSGGQTRARAGPQTWALPTGQGGLPAGAGAGGLGGSEEEPVLPGAPSRNAGSQAPRSTLRACLLFSPAFDTIID